MADNTPVPERPPDGRAAPDARLQLAPSPLLESALKFAQQADMLPADADFLMLAAKDRAGVHVGAIVRIGENWKLVGEIGIAPDREIGGAIAIVGKL